MSAAIAITGIHTDVGKTIASILVAEALAADYWKPVQAGSLEEKDSDKVRRLVSSSITVHPETFVFREPLSPPAAAKAEGRDICMLGITLPETDNLLIVETAGGVLSPVDPEFTMADFIMAHHLPAILVVRHYLGSIHHTVSSIEALQKRAVRLYGVIVNGPPDQESEDFIRSYTRAEVLAHIPWIEPLTQHTIAAHASLLKDQLKTKLSKWLV